MKICKSCRKEIDEQATKCPYCQTDQRNWFRQHPVMITILGFLFLMILLSSGSSKKETKLVSPVSNETKETQTPSPTQPPVVSDEQLIASLSQTFCAERQCKPIAGNPFCGWTVDLNDLNQLFENKGQVTTLHTAKDSPTQTICKKVAKGCLETWSNKVCEMVANREIWIGMTKDMLMASFGIPNDRNNSTNQWGFSSQWVYGSPINGATYIYLDGENENSMKVTSWQDSD